MREDKSSPKRVEKAAVDELRLGLREHLPNVNDRLVFADNLLQVVLRRRLEREHFGHRVPVAVLKSSYTQVLIGLQEYEFSGAL